LSRLRDAAEKVFVTTQLQPALQQYGQANNGQFPTDLSQLNSYFNPPVDDSILQRWEIVPVSAIGNVGGAGDSVITQIAAVDADYDARFWQGPGYMGQCAIGAGNWSPKSPDSEAKNPAP
jgi:hypothetical protein